MRGRPLTRLTFDPAIDHESRLDARRSAHRLRARTAPVASNLFIQAADGTGVVERLTTSADHQSPACVAPDGTGVVGWTVAPRTNGDIVWFPLKSPASGPGRARVPAASLSDGEPIVQTPAMEFHPEVSPDGRYIAYQSNESGRDEIYVRPFPRVNDGRWQVSTGGGTRAVWARNGRELFFVDPANMLTAVPVQTSGATFVMGNPAKLFETAFAVTLNAPRDYDVAPNGQRFLMINENAGARSERHAGRHGRRAELDGSVEGQVPAGGEAASPPS